MSTILVIDRNKAVLFAFESFLVKEGFKAIVTPSFESVFDQLDTNDIRALIIDFSTLAHLDPELLQELIFRIKDLPVILLTNHFLQNNASLIRSLNVKAHLEKPISVSGIRAVMEELKLRPDQSEHTGGIPLSSSGKVT